MASYEITDRRRALLDGMDGNDIPGPDGTGGLTGKAPSITLDPSKGLPYTNPGFLPGEPDPNGETPTKKDPFAMPKGATVEQAMQAANDAAYGYNKHQDPNYWSKMWADDPEYTWKRMIGMGAGPQDAAKFGQWAGGDPNAEQLGGGGGGIVAPSLGNQPMFGGVNMGDVLSEIQALIAGNGSPMNRSAILSQLRG